MKSILLYVAAVAAASDLSLPVGAVVDQKLFPWKLPDYGCQSLDGR